LQDEIEKAKIVAKMIAIVSIDFFILNLDIVFNLLSKAFVLRLHRFVPYLFGFSHPLRLHLNKSYLQNCVNFQY
jgi:hypothetical protein